MRPSAEPADDLAGLFRAYHLELVRLAAFVLGDVAAAEDVVQDVFVRLQQRRDSLAGQRDPLPYLRTAVVNGCRSAFKRRASLLQRQAAAANEPAALPPLTAEESVLLSEDRRRLLAALAALPQRRREVLVLRYYAGMSEAEIATTLGISPGTVKSTAARGLDALARILEELR
jgi:RNA polymerase sigma-70 factor (sigma-E family)